MPKQLFMVHDEIETVATVVDAGVFNAVWAPRGWVLLDAPEAYASEVLGQPVKDIEALKVKELRALISSRPESDYPASNVLKAELVTIFRDTFPAQSPAEVEAVEVATAAGLPVVAVDQVDEPLTEDPDVPLPVDDDTDTES